MRTVQTLLPPNATPLQKAIEQSTARVGEVDGHTVGTLWNAQTCSSAFLPYLAWAWSVDTWNAAWPDSVKRAVIAAAPEVKRLRGTLGAVRRALAAIGATIQVSEWWQTGGAPYTATLRVYAQGAMGQPQLSPDLIADLQSALTASQPARVQTTTVFGVSFTPSNIGAALMAPIALLRTRATTAQPVAGALSIGAALLAPIDVLRAQASVAF